MNAILALDGGGVRGAITVAFLERIEAVLGGNVRLADRFHLVGGTSTGAIIAGALALGYSASDIRAFYLTLAPKVFRRQRWRLPGVHTRFDAAPLMAEIERVVGERTLGSDDLLTHLAIVMKRMDTGSAWVVTTSPNGRYWDDPPDGAYVGNRHFMLKNLIRASTAAPHYFAPELIPILMDQPPGLFVDGGVTPHNTPALLLAMVATIPAYGFGWPLGADALTVVSIGTGAYRARLDPRTARTMSPIGLAIRALSSMIKDSEEHTLALCQWLGRTETPWPVNDEVGAPNGVANPLFTFLRYNVRLEADWLSQNLGMTVRDADIARLRRMDDASAIPLAYAIGQAAAERSVRPEHLASLTSVRGGRGPSP